MRVTVPPIKSQGIKTKLVPWISSIVRFGAYGKALRDESRVSEFVLPMLRVQHKLFESLNDACNKRSFAHDNELFAVSEAQFIADSVLASLAFIERLETARAADLSEPDDSIPF